jgi:hypothetical protein
MLGPRRAALLVSVALAGLCWGIGPSWADDGYGTIRCDQNPVATCDLDAGKDPKTTRVEDPVRAEDDGEDSRDDGVQCRYVPVDYQDPGGQPSGPGGWYMVLCSPDGKDPFSHGPVFVPDGADAAVSAQELSRIARARLRLPAPGIAASPAGEQLVNLPTWLWLSGGWVPVSATASVPGVSVTAVATPTSVVWSMGDGGTVRCDGPGTAFRVGVDPAAPSPDCGYTYRSSSAGQPTQAFPVAATVHWTVTWSGAGQSGTFPDLTTTSSTTVRVAEAQALNTRSR